MSKKLIGGLAKATIGLTVRTPIAIAADILTLGGNCDMRDRGYTFETLDQVSRDIGDALSKDDAA